MALERPHSNQNSHRGQSAVECWGVTEGAAGMVSQVKGLAQAVGLPFELQSRVLKFPWKKMWPGWIPSLQFIFQDQSGLVAEVPPRLIISCGRQAVMTALYMKKRYGDKVFTVHIQDPKIDSRKFDLVIAPEHDGLTGSNVITTPGAVHHVNYDVLAAAGRGGMQKALSKLQQPFVTVLLGGPNRVYEFNCDTLLGLRDSLRTLVANQPVQLAILASRRTPQEVVDLFDQEFGTDHLVWSTWTDNGHPNPYMEALSLCSHIIATGDSVSMISEAAATEKPVYVYALPENRVSKRFRRFHESFEAKEITRAFTGSLETWNYSYPNVTNQIAELIRDRLGVCHVTSACSAA